MFRDNISSSADSNAFLRLPEIPKDVEVRGEETSVGGWTNKKLWCMMAYS